MKFLLDECMHTSLVEVAHEFGFVAHHVSHMGMAGLKDWQVMDRVIREEFTFVTNNRTDFVALFARLDLHSGLVVIVPNVAPARQRIMLRAALAHIGQGDMVWLKSSSPALMSSVPSMRFQGDSGTARLLC
jgi:predicted nuclease of predicted toxin-antitoxin system